MNFVDLKHISKQGSNFNKHDIYYGNVNMWSSFRDFAFGYYEMGNVGFIAFIKYK